MHTHSFFVYLSLHLHKTEVRYLYNTAKTLLTVRVALSILTDRVQSCPHFNKHNVMMLLIFSVVFLILSTSCLIFIMAFLIFYAVIWLPAPQASLFINTLIIQLWCLKWASSSACLSDSCLKWASSCLGKQASLLAHCSASLTKWFPEWLMSASIYQDEVSILFPSYNNVLTLSSNSFNIWSYFANSLGHSIFLKSAVAGMICHIPCWLLSTNSGEWWSESWNCLLSISMVM